MIAKKAYDKAFATQVLVSGKDAKAAKQLYKAASAIGRRNKVIRESVMEMVESVRS